MAKKKKSGKTRSAVTHTTTEKEKKDRTKRTNAELVKMLREKIDAVEAREVRQSEKRKTNAPEVKALMSVIKSIAKAYTKAEAAEGESAELVAQALTDCNDTLTELLSAIQAPEEEAE